MFLVGGGILMYGIPLAYDEVHHAAEALKSMPLGNVMGVITSMLLNAIAGAIVLLGVNLLSPLLSAFNKET